MRSAPPALLPILRSQVAGNLLALLYLHPEDEYSLTEAASAIGASLNAVHYEVSKLAEGSLIRTRKRGNLRLIRAVTDSPLSRPLTDLLAVTYGPLPVLGDLIAGVTGITEAYIYGSWAARYSGEPGPTPADVDVLVVGMADPDDLDEVAERAQNTLRRPVNIRRIRPETWTASNPADPFIRSVKSRPLVTIVGSARVLERTVHEVGPRPSTRPPTRPRSLPTTSAKTRQPPKNSSTSPLVS
jgi:DNA-binding transcriptional ArsR family regulator